MLEGLIDYHSPQPVGLASKLLSNIFNLTLIRKLNERRYESINGKEN
jgi:hypothetical protein